MTKISKAVRAAILSKDKNHEFGKDGFCLLCPMHRTDWRQNDLCPALLKEKAETWEEKELRACAFLGPSSSF